MITVKYFASLRERLGRGEETVEPDQVRTVGEVWTHATGAATLPPRVLTAVNQVYADLNTPVKDGDEVAFFPPMTGG